MSDQDYLSTIEDVIEDARNGKMFILVDDEERENEGDLVIPAQMATPEVINFMAKHGRGLICLAMPRERTDELGLKLMEQNNRTRHQTAFTVSIESRDGVSTGISAHDRARTMAVAIDPTKNQRHIVSPGHVFPLIAREGGVLIRTGHTEAAVDVARLAGLNPAGVICEIMNDDGTMARMPDLIKFAQFHGLKIASIADLIAYRRKHDSVVHLVAETKVDSAFGGTFEMRVYGTTVEPAQEHVALIRGDLSTGGPVLVRVHACSTLTDTLGVSGQGFRRTLVQKAMEAISAEGRGVLVLIREVWPAAVSDTLAQHGQPPEEPSTSDSRFLELGIGSQILHDLGVRDMVLLSNSPRRRLVGLEGYGLRVVGHRRLD